MHLTKAQLDTISKYLLDVSKLVFAATVLGFFIQMGTQPVTARAFIGGMVITAVTAWFGVKLAR